MWAGKKYAKFNVYCPDGKHSNNSVDMRVINNPSIVDLIREVGRVNGFKVSYIDKTLELGDMKDDNELNTWSCFANKEKISDFDKKLEESSDISCFFGMDTKNIDLILNGKN